MNTAAFEPVHAEPYSNGIWLDPIPGQHGGQNMAYTIRDADGSSVGRIGFSFEAMPSTGEEPDGRIRMWANSMSLQSESQGTGLASEMIARLMMIQNQNPQIGEIRVSANITVGGYAWARNFDFSSGSMPGYANRRLDTMTEALRLLGEGEWVQYDNIPYLLRNFGGSVARNSDGAYKIEDIVVDHIKPLLSSYESRPTQVARRLTQEWLQHRESLLERIELIRNWEPGEPGLANALARLGKGNGSISAGTGGATKGWHIGKLALIGGNWGGIISIPDDDEWRQRRQDWRVT
jgi:hypothetical protein